MNEQIKITFLDGSKRSVEKGITGLSIADSIAKIHTLKDGRKVTDINYANLITKHKKESKQKQEERQQELDIQFDPDIKLD